MRSFRFESILVNFGMMTFGYFSLSGLIGFMITCAATVGILMKSDIQTPKILILIVYYITKFISSIGYIPIIMILVIDFKYSYFKYDKIQEYDIEIEDNIYGNFTGAFSLVSVIFVYFWIFLFKIFESDIRHSHSSRNIYAKSNSSLDIT